MKIENEAKMHMHIKAEKFNKEVSSKFKEVENFINNKCWNSQEREQSLMHLQSALLWTKHAVDRFGHK